MKLRQLGAVGVVSALLLGLLGMTSLPATAAGSTTIVKGKVTLNGKPVKGATVRLTILGSDDGGKATTKKDGTYSIKAAPGWWAVAVDNYVYDYETDESTTFAFLRTFSGNTVRLPDAKKYTIKKGSTRTVNIKVVAGATVKGKVVDEKGRALKNALVTASNSTRAGYESVRTDSKGRYEIKGLATGPVWISASSSGPDRFGFVDKVSAVQGKTVTAKTIVAKKEPKGTLSATVKNLKPGDEVYVYDTKTKWASLLGAPENGGTFKVSTKLAPGSYRVVVGGTNTATKAVTVKKNKKTSAGTLTAPSKRTKVSGTIKGSNGKVLKEAAVWISDSYGTYVGGATTSSKGKYSVSGVVSGKYTVQVSDVTRRNADKSSSFSVKKGKNAKKSVRLSKAYKVSGTVKYAGKPVEGVIVSGGENWIETSKKGKFTLVGLRGKTYISVSDYYVGGYLNASKTLTVKKNLTQNFSLKK